MILAIVMMCAATAAAPNRVAHLRICSLHGHEYTMDVRPKQRCTGYDLAGNLCKGVVQRVATRCCNVYALCSPTHGTCNKGVPMGVCPPSEVIVPAKPCDIVTDCGTLYVAVPGEMDGMGTFSVYTPVCTPLGS